MYYYNVLQCTTLYNYVLMYMAVIGDASSDSASDHLLAGLSGAMCWASGSLAMAMPDHLLAGPLAVIGGGVLAALKDVKRPKHNWPQRSLAARTNPTIN